ncbi:MAG: hypothetical protein K9N46_16030 [Candidatus Marinimicrobia bacterium]|nr:hypothetical protein [Candidatus Neomarinimicrobiota bacterium]MCF7829585.1 hypothetical protein [Candidatus Neomarinimicrobiota bacterium]MCF7882239.1 hypothetical protein [Candidatus Neomarinimicrobiota bacterium]
MNVPWINKRIIPVLLILLVGLSGCTFWQPAGERSPAEDYRTRLQMEKRKALSQATDSLLALSPQESPALYTEQRQQFRQALIEYLQVADSTEREMVLLNHDGSIVVLPVDTREFASAGDSLRTPQTPLQVWKTVGPGVRGKVLDLVWLGDRIRDSGMLVTLFADSVDIYRIDADIKRLYHHEFPSETFHSLRSAGAATWVLSKDSAITDISVITSTLESANIISIQSSDIRIRPAENAGQAPWSVASWHSVSGQDLFANDHFTPGEFRSLRRFPSVNRTVLLDAAGYLHLLDSNGQTHLWKSERAWGIRIYRLGNRQLGVLTEDARSFVMFNVEERALSLRGQSPEFPAPVTALTGARLWDTKGFIVSLASQNRVSQRGQFQFIPADKIRWSASVNYKAPVLPDYSSRIALVTPEEITEEPAGRISANLARNISETLFTIGDDRRVRPLVARDSEHLGGWTAWDIHLRRDVRFSEGTPLTAGDIKRSWERRWQECRTGKCSDQWLWQMIAGVPEFLSGETDTISGIEVVDQHTLRIRLSEPQPYFIEHLTHHTFRINKTVESGIPVGTGPFRITDFPEQAAEATGQNLPMETDGWNLFSVLRAQEPGARETTPVTLARNPYYYRGYPYIEQLQIYPRSLEVSDSLLQERNILSQVQHQQDVIYYQKLPQVSVRPFPVNPVYFLAMNPDSPLLGSAGVRRIISGALDKSVTANIIDEAECTVTSRFFGNRQIEPSSAELSDSAAISEPVSIAYRSGDPVGRQIAERLAARLSQQNIPREIPQGVPGDQFEEMRSRGDYGILVDTYSPAFGTPIYNLVDLLNRGYAINQDMKNALHARLSSAPQNYPSAIEEHLINEGILVPVFRVTKYSVLPTELRGIQLLGTQEYGFSKAWMPIR